MPWADALYAQDRVWWQQYEREVEEAFPGERWSRNTIPGVRKLRVEASQNSGAGAIALAASQGACKVVLLGYDCQLTGGRAHWHPDHPGRMGNCGALADGPRQYHQLAGQLPGIQIINCSRSTALDVFPLGRLEEVLA